MRDYKILTKKSVLEIQNDISELDNIAQEKALTNLWNEQTELITGEYFAIHFIEDKHFIDERYETSNDITETIQSLAIKDGVDLVEFDNGNMGFVAYYNGHKNAFEFKEISKEQFCNDEFEETIETLFN